MTRVFESDELICWLLEGASPYLVITFNELGFDKDDERFWGEQVCRKLGLSALGIVSKRPNWFPQADVQAAAAVFEQAHGARFVERISYGFSKGAYGAIKFSALFKARTVIAFSPQWSIDPSDIHDVRFAAHFEAHHHPRMHIAQRDVSCRPYVFYDPHDGPENRQMSRLAEMCDILQVPLINCGHATIRGLGGSASFMRLLTACRSGDERSVRALAPGIRRRNPFRSGFLAFSALRRHPGVAYRIFRKHRASIPQVLWGRICVRLATSGHLDEVMGWLDGLLKDGYCTTEVLSIVSALYERKKHYGMALLVLDYAIMIHLGDAALIERRQTIVKKYGIDHPRPAADFRFRP